MQPTLLLTPAKAAELIGITPAILITVGAPFIPIQGRGEGRRLHRRYSRPVLLAWLTGQSPTLGTADCGLVSQ